MVSRLFNKSTLHSDDVKVAELFVDLDILVTITKFTKRSKIAFPGKPASQGVNAEWAVGCSPPGQTVLSTTLNVARTRCD